MIRHPHILHLLSDYIDGCLSAAATRRVEAHLMSCPACAGELEQWRAVLQLVSRHASVPCPIDCAEAVVQRLNEGAGRSADGRRTDHRFRAPYRFIWVSLATGLVMLFSGWTWV